MLKSEFFFNLPESQIAQTPIHPRDNSRMMLCKRGEGYAGEGHFYDIIDYLKAGDVLVMNDSKVLPARLLGHKVSGTAAIELLLLSQKEKDIWEVLARPGKKAKPGTRFSFGGGLLECEVLESDLPGGNRLVKFYYEGDFFSVIDKVGEMPLPHYITAKLTDRSRYQTVYADEPGSAAAPTAGLHFTDELLGRIRAKGVETAFVTLHVGLGTFRPVKADNITEHMMHSEHFHISREVADKINRAKASGGRVIAVGSTSCRTLETAGHEQQISEADGYTDIFIYPGYDFKIVDALITNFHLPESSLIMMVSAFMGHQETMSAYKTAIDKGYRFYSFGDCMFIDK